MRNKRDRYSKLIYYNLFIKFFSVCCVIIGCISTINFYITKNNTLHTIEKYDISLLRQIESSVETMHVITTSIANSLYNDLSIQKILSGNIREIEVTEIFNAVNQRILPYPLIHSVYLFDGNEEVFYTFGKVNSIRNTTDFIDEEALEYIKNFEVLNKLEPIPRKIPDLNDIDGMTHDVYSYFLLEKDFNVNKIDKAIIINIYTSWLLEYIDSIDLETQFGGSEFYITNKNGLIIALDHPISDLQSLSDTDLFKSIFETKDTEGVIYTSWKDEKQVASFVKVSSPAWNIISLKPVKSFMAKIIIIRNWTIVLSGLFSIIGLLLSIYITKKLFNPIERMRSILHPFEDIDSKNQITFQNSLNSFFNLSISKFNKLSQMQHSFDDNQKEIALINLISGNVDFNDDYLGEINDYNLNINLTETLVLFLIRIDKHLQFSHQFSKNEQISILNGTRQIAISPIRKSFGCELMISSDFTITGIVSIPQTDQPIAAREQLITILKDIQTFTINKLSLTITITLSDEFSDLELITSENKKIETISKYRILKGYGQIILPEILNGRIMVFDLHVIPKDMISCIYTERYNQIETLLILYFDKLQFYQVDLIYYGISYLLIKIFDEIKTLENKGLYDFQIDFSELNNRFIGKEIIAEIIDEFRYLFKQIENVREGGKKHKDIHLVNTITEYINTSYSDNNLCLKDAAGVFGYSREYLGKTFKRITMVSFSEYLKSVRLEKAEKLLITTNLNIGTIMYKIGWTNEKYFYTIFKSKFGLPPGNYRLKNRQKNL